MFFRRFFGVILLVLVMGSFRVMAVERWADDPHVGIAVGDAATVPLTNPAGLGIGDATGLGFSAYLNSGGLYAGSVHVAMGWMSYAFRTGFGPDNHEIGLGVPVFRKSLYGGLSVRWDVGDVPGVNLALLYRPISYLSFGVKGQSLNVNPWMDFGVAFRPLAFSENWGSRLSLFYDGRVTHSAGYEHLAAGIRFEPLNGLELYGHWDFPKGQPVAGVNLSLSRVLLGGAVNVPVDQVDPDKLTGNIDGFVSLKRMRSLGDRRNKLIVYNMAGRISDSPGLIRNIAGIPVNGNKRSLYDFFQDMEMLAGRKDVSGVLFNNQDFVTSFSNLSEISQALEALKQSGKRIYFYAESLSNTRYAMAASVADEIYLPPGGHVDVNGFSATRLYFRGLLEEYGIKVVNFRSHESKSAFDLFSESGMSEADRNQLQGFLDSLEDQMDEMILQGRSDKLTMDLGSLHAEGFWVNAGKAKQYGLIDDTLYPDQLNDRLKKNYKLVPFTQLTWEMENNWPKVHDGTVAVIYAEGPIVTGKGQKRSSIGSSSLARAIRQARKNSTVKAIVLRVNSGGGSALASDLIAREISLSTEGPNKKPVIISMGASAASGGYMISAPADYIMATPVTLTGSIGVIAMVPDLSGLLEKYNIETETVPGSESADTPNILRPLTESEIEKIRSVIADDYDRFVTLVAENRNFSDDEISEVAEGRIWSGRDALDNQLTDGMGGLSDAVDLAVDMAGLKRPRVLEVSPGGFSFTPQIREFVSSMFGIENGLADVVPGQLRDVYEFYKLLNQYEQGEGLYLLPYSREELGISE